MDSSKLKKRAMSEERKKSYDDLMRWIVSVGLGGAGAGAAYRGGSALYNLYRRHKAKKFRNLDSTTGTYGTDPLVAATSPALVQARIAREEQEEGGPEKVASDSLGHDTSWLGGYDPFGYILGASNHPGPTSHPLALPLATVAATGGLYAGYQGADFLLDQIRKKYLKKKLDRRRKKYYSLLSDGLDDKADRRKSASEDTSPGWVGYPNALLGGLLLTSLGLGASGLMDGWDSANPGRKRKALKRMRRQFAAEQYAKTPPPIFLTSVEPEEPEELEESAAEKVTSGSVAPKKIRLRPKKKKKIKPAPPVAVPDELEDEELSEDKQAQLLLFDLLRRVVRV